MAIYRFKVCFEEDDEIIRVIEVRSGQTLEDLHFAILKSIEFDTRHNALFYISDDYWKKHDKFVFLPETGMEETTMFSSTKLSTLINDPHQKLLYIYDLSEQWVFMVELVGIAMNEDPKKSYPQVVRSESKPPKQYKTQRKVGADLEDDEFDYLTKNLLGGEIAGEMLGEHLDIGETDDMGEETIAGDDVVDEVDEVDEVEDDVVDDVVDEEEEDNTEDLFGEEGFEED